MCSAFNICGRIVSTILGLALIFLARPNPDKYADELLDIYLFIEDADALYAEHANRGVKFTGAVANTPWHSREFIGKDCDGRLLAFGANPE